MNNPTSDWTVFTDEELAAHTAAGVDAAERELLGRQMQAIYWLPQRAFGAPEEDLADFLIYALEKIRERDILAKYDPLQGARFSTWFGAVIRRLYLDYLRARQPALPVVDLAEAETIPGPPPTAPEPAVELLAALQTRCRVLFKLLLCDTFFITTDEVTWLAEESGKSLLQVAAEIAELEERLRQTESSIQSKYDKLAKVHWWKNNYEKQLARLEKSLSLPWTENRTEVEAAHAKLLRRREEYERLVGELAGGGGLATAPYRDLAVLLNVKEGTLASQISRCRSGAADLARRQH